MTRIGKQQERRNQCPKRPRAPAKKTGSLKDNLEHGYKTHANAIDSDSTQQFFIPKIK